MDDEIALSPFALQALQQFYQEQQDQEEKFKKLEQIAESRFQGVQAEENTTIENVELEIADFKEDWQLSQFWYDDETATKLAKEAIRIAPKGGIICCISSPSAFMKLRVSTFILLNLLSIFDPFLTQHCYFRPFLTQKITIITCLNTINDSVSLENLMFITIIATH